MTTIYHLGQSGGKDSGAAGLWLVKESGIPHEQIRMTFCDTGNEHALTYEHIAMFSRDVFPIETIRPPRDFYELALHKGRFPSPRARFCTEELKIKPSMAYVQSLMDAGHEVVMVSGVRASESLERAKLPEREWDERYDCEHWRPLLRWSLADVWAIHERYGIPPNPLYAMGSQRVGCLPCIMSRKAEIANVATRFSDRIDRIRAAEYAARDTARGGATFFASDKIPLRYRLTVWQRPGTETIADEPAALPPTQETQPVTGQLLAVRPMTRRKHNHGVNRHAIAAIDDVVRWATADIRAAEASPMLPFADEIEEAPSCASRWGLCE